MVGSNCGESVGNQFLKIFDVNLKIEIKKMFISVLQIFKSPKGNALICMIKKELLTSNTGF
jgi:hypothetical protein